MWTVCRGQSISAPCFMYLVPHIWLTYMLAGRAYPLANQSMLCSLSVNRCSNANCLILRQPAMKGVSICSAAAVMLFVLVKIMPRYLKVSLLASCDLLAWTQAPLCVESLSAPPLIQMCSQSVPSLERRRSAYPTSSAVVLAHLQLSSDHLHTACVSRNRQLLLSLPHARPELCNQHHWCTERKAKVKEGTLVWHH